MDKLDDARALCLGSGSGRQTFWSLRDPWLVGRWQVSKSCTVRMAHSLLQQGHLHLASSLQHSTAWRCCLQPAAKLRQRQQQPRQPLCCRAKAQSEASERQWSPAFQRGLLVLLAENLWHPQLALADSIQYDPTQGSEAIKYVFGGAYILGAALFFWKVFGRRAKRFREEVCMRT